MTSLSTRRQLVHKLVRFALRSEYRQITNVCPLRYVAVCGFQPINLHESTASERWRAIEGRASWIPGEGGAKPHHMALRSLQLNTRSTTTNQLHPDDEERLRAFASWGGRGQAVSYGNTVSAARYQIKPPQISFIGATKSD